MRNTKETRMKTREELLQEIGELKKLCDSWEKQVKRLLTRNGQLLEDISRLSAQLRLWKGTAP